MIRSIVTVTVAADNKDLVSLEDTKIDLGITGSTEDAALQRMISGASSAIAEYCNRVLVEETVSEQLRLGGGERAYFGHNNHGVEDLILARSPVSNITSVTEGTTVLASTLYEVNPDSGILSRLCNDRLTRWCVHKIVVVYVAGYSLAKMPDSLKRAVTTMVKLFRASQTRDPTVKAQQVTDIERLEFWVGAIGENGALPPDVVSLIGSFRRGRISGV